MNVKNCAFPTNKKDMQDLLWEQCDYIIVSGDAFVDHPSFGTAIIARLLESLGNKVGLICQPPWQDEKAFQVLGRPKKAFLVTAGAVDSMVAHYTSANKPRSSDAYTPGGKAGLRPNRAVITYTMRIRQAYKEVLVIAGGIEASLRRLSHYDYWSDTIRRSILLDAKLDAIVYGMGEYQIRKLDEVLSSGGGIEDIHTIPGIVYASHRSSAVFQDGVNQVFLPEYDEVSKRDLKANLLTNEAKEAFAFSTRERLLHENPMKPCRIIEPYGNIVVVQNPVPPPLSQEEMDMVYALPFTRMPLNGRMDIPAVKEVLFSITSSRGCYGSCTFCSLRAHQGRIIQSRSISSILAEARRITKDPLFKGNIHDIGGPTANFRQPACARQLTPGKGPCEQRECLFPTQCPSVIDDQMEYLEVLSQARNLPGVTHVFVRSGIRYDHLLSSPPALRRRFLTAFCKHHVSGQLKVAPEHVSPRVLDAMGKPGIDLFDAFSGEYTEINQEIGKRQYLIPYLISSHPGSRLEDAVELAEYLSRFAFIPDQIQDFYPTPGTVASCMYVTGLDPRPGRNFSPVYVPRGREKKLQRALLHHHKKENRALVREALQKVGKPETLLFKRINRK